MRPVQDERAHLCRRGPKTAKPAQVSFFAVHSSACERFSVMQCDPIKTGCRSRREPAVPSACSVCGFAFDMSSETGETIDELTVQLSESSKREYLLAQIRQKDAIIESLLKQVGAQ